MPISQAAMEGITANGHRWKHNISLGGQSEIMGTMDEDTPEDEVEACAKAIVVRVRAFAKSRTVRNPLLSEQLEHEADTLDEVADCGLVEVRHAMMSIYDTFDYHRVCVTG